jgi:TRAP-type uncharacterized transport system substrate-binding protein
MQLSGIVFRFGRWVSWSVMLLSVIGVIYWGYGLTTPSVLRIATGRVGSYANDFGHILKKQLEKNTDYTVKLKETSGSVDNRRLLLSGEVDLAVVKSGFVSLENLMVINPLWMDYLHIIVLKDEKIEDLKQLKRKSFALGPPGTVNRRLTSKVLEYYGVKSEDLDDTQADIRKLPSGDKRYIGGATVTNLLDFDFMKQVRNDQYRWFPVPRVAGLAHHFPYFYKATIPAGSFSTAIGSRPHISQETLATTSVLAVKDGMSHQLIQSILPVLNMSALFKEAPILLGQGWTKDPRWQRLPIHPAAVRYFETYAGLEMLSEFIELINKYKILIILLFLFLFFANIERIRRRDSIKEKVVHEEMRKLEIWVEQVVQIEQEQKKAKDIRLLRQYHQDALLIKEQALKEIIGNDIQDTNFFLMFMQQCIHVIHEIEFKISGLRN